jgi:uncharacterized membrane protein
MIDATPGQTAPAPMPPGAPDAAQSNLRSLVILCYVLYLLALVNGVTAIAGVIIAYVKRADARDTIWYSHFDTMIVTFWVMLIAGFVGTVSFLFSLGGVLAWPIIHPALSLVTLMFGGLLIFPIFAVWYLYRVIKGLVRASDDRPY